jgi:hypothetical protein
LSIPVPPANERTSRASPMPVILDGRENADWCRPAPQTGNRARKVGQPRLDNLKRRCQPSRDFSL